MTRPRTNRNQSAMGANRARNVLTPFRGPEKACADITLAHRNEPGYAECEQCGRWVRVRKTDGGLYSHRARYAPCIGAEPTT